MRFPTAWANIADQNITLKSTIVALSIALVTVSVLAAKTGLREPVVVERGCYTTTAQKGDNARSNEEIAAFVKEAVGARFNTDGKPNLELLSRGQIQAKKTEEDGLASKKMRQTVIVNNVSIDGDVISVDADRLVAVEKIRSAFSFPLSVSVSKTSRSQSNPYGLVLTQITPIKDEKESN